MTVKMPKDGRSRVVIEGVQPQIDGGAFPIKRCIGESVVVDAHVLADGHEVLSCMLCHRRGDSGEWLETPMEHLGNDEWRAEFPVDVLGLYHYTVLAWVDRFLSWRHDLERREDPADVLVALQVGVEIVKAAAARADAAGKVALNDYVRRLANTSDLEAGRAAAMEPALEQLLGAYGERHFATRCEREFSVRVDPVRARFSAWYEFFPRSSWGDIQGHGRLKDCEARLDYVASMGFDVLYLPPIHPIGRMHRKGLNNARTAKPGDHGSPWAIGADEGGHTAVHPDLGTLDDLRSLVARARERGIDVALDIAFQCAPDHPWVKAHPQWFRHRPDGSVQYAENPPKKYQDIYPFDFETDDWKALWKALRDVMLFWGEQGVRILRVDNPHTKPFPMWEWLITEVKARYPEMIFLAEAFTRPKVMKRLAKAGFTQSYTYFTWRHTKAEFTEYLDELNHTEMREYFRPNFWPNTPDILPEFLQHSGRAGFVLRATLAATMTANWGIYGPAFELQDCAPRAPGAEEYLDSEKYEIKHWDIARHDSLADILGRLNAIRRDNPALQSDWSIAFHPTDNDMLMCYSKREGDNVVVVVANLDPQRTQTGWIDLPLEDFEIEPGHMFQAHDLLSDARYLWHGAHNFILLDPNICPVHVFRLRRHLRTENDFDYFM